MAKAREKTQCKPRIRERRSRRKLGAKIYRNYSDEMLQIACDAVATKQITSRDAERQFGIPRRTIVNKVLQRHMKQMGRPTCLTDLEERKIVKALGAAADFGSPLTKLDLKLVVHDYLEKNSRHTVFKGNLPGKDWVQNFLRRHAHELTVRLTQNISRARASKGAEEIAEYFCQLSQTLKDVPPENIVNLDETNLSDDPGATKCIFRRGVKYPERVVNSTKGNISLMFTATASGQCLPLYIVYKAEHIYSEWVTGGPPNTRYNRTKSGWFDRPVFEEYFETIILPWAASVSGTKVVICDNLSSHLSIKILELCEENDIKFVFIPPRSTHLTQPLDVAFFAPLKKAWRKILYTYKLQNPAQKSLNKKHFPKLLTELTNAINLQQIKNVKSGFRATGIVPLNPQEVLKRIPEHQDEILSYGIDEALLNYLKETKAEKPIPVIRSTKILCEPGKSVTVADINLPNQNQNDAKKYIKKTKKRTIKKQKSLDLNNIPVNHADDYNNDSFLDDQTGIYVNLRENVTCDADNDEPNCDQLDSTMQGYLDEETGLYSNIDAIDYDIINSWMENDSGSILKGQLQEESNAFSSSDSDATVTLDYPIHNDVKKTKYNILKIKSENKIYEYSSNENKCSSNSFVNQLSGPSTSKGLTHINSQAFFRPFTNFSSDTDTDTEELTGIQTIQTKPRVTDTRQSIVTISTYRQETKKSQYIALEPLTALCIQKINAIFSYDEHHQRTGTSQNLRLDVQSPFESNFEVSETTTTVTPKTEVKPSQSKKITILEDKHLSKEEKFPTFSKLFKTSNKNKKKVRLNKHKQNDEIVYCDSDTDESWNEYRYRTLNDKINTTDEEGSDKENIVIETTYDTTFTVGRYVLVRFSTKKTDKHYAGLIVEICDTANKSFKVRFLRKKNNNFVWPIVDDVSFVFIEDIAAVLPEPNSSRRGKLTFIFDFSKYNVS